MFDIEAELRKYGLTREKYEACLEDIFGKVSGRNDLDWADIVEMYGLKMHSDTLRKASNTIFGGGFVREYMKEKESRENRGGSVDDVYLAMLLREKNAITKERQKLRDEKLEYNRLLREEARDELITERICEAVRELPSLVVPEPLPISETRKEGIVVFADTHYGAEFEIRGLHGEVINRYSPEVFEERMEQFLAEIERVVTEEGLTSIKVYSLGDELDGTLRVSQLMKLKYGVVESTIRYSDYISRWLTALSRFVNVEYQMSEGNHTELRMLGQPKGTFTKDNMSSIIREFIAVRMEENPNFRMKRNESGLIFDRVAGYNLLGIHGEVKNLASAIQEFSNIYDTTIDVLLAGHKHHFAGETVGINRDVIGVPSIIGVDDYSIQMRKAANAGAVVLILEEGLGVTKQYNLKLGKQREKGI